MAYDQIDTLKRQAQEIMRGRDGDHTTMVVEADVLYALIEHLEGMEEELEDLKESG